MNEIMNEISILYYVYNLERYLLNNSNIECKFKINKYGIFTPKKNLYLIRIRQFKTTGSIYIEGIYLVEDFVSVGIPNLENSNLETLDLYCSSLVKVKTYFRFKFNLNPYNEGVSILDKYYFFDDKNKAENFLIKKK